MDRFSSHIKDRDKTGNYITVKDHVVHDAAFQYHSLCISQDYTLYILILVRKRCLGHIFTFFSAGSFTSDVFAFFRPLHIELVFLVCTGEMIKGTGLEDLLSSSSLSTVGLSTGTCDANHIKNPVILGKL